MEKKRSEYIADFLDFMREAQQEYDWCLEKQKEEEGMTQDLLHILELEDTGYHERARLAGRLRDARKERRRYKDAVEELEEIVGFAKEHRKFLNDLSQMLGAVRKQEKYHANRSYHLKVLKDKAFEKQGKRKEDGDGQKDCD